MNQSKNLQAPIYHHFIGFISKNYLIARHGGISFNRLEKSHVLKKIRVEEEVERYWDKCGSTPRKHWKIRKTLHLTTKIRNWRNKKMLKINMVQL